MALQSMTGFARSDGTHGSFGFAWELRSVNGKGLDVRLRMPSGYERLEIEARRLLTSRFARGNIQASLNVSSDKGPLIPVVNEGALEAVIALMERLRPRVEAAPPRLDGLLAIRGVLDFTEEGEDESDRDAKESRLLEGLDRAIGDLQAMRVDEGVALAAVLTSHIDRIEECVATIEADPSRSADAIKERLAAQVALLSSDRALDPERLHAEAVLLATKADVREELDRLTAHIAAARALIAGEGPVGRRLDFLAQEFNREANTICSKSNATAVTNQGMELKVVIDQMREQIQNLE